MAVRVLARLALLPTLALFAQSSFEVASVKPASPGESAEFQLHPGGRLHIANLPLWVILQQAYSVKAYQLSGGSAWLKTDGFNIDAKAAEGDVSKERMMTLLQSLLAERFQLKVHRETREGRVYALVTAKGGPKLKISEATETWVRLQRNTPTQLPGVNYTIAGRKASVHLLAERLGEMNLHLPVLDRTGISGEFDFELTYATDDNPDTGPSIFTAIQEQLGLKLEPARGPIETLFIDHVERPSGN